MYNVFLYITRVDTGMCCPKGVWMSIFHIINLEKKKIMDTGVLDFFLIKNNPGLLFLIIKSGPVFLFQIFIIAPPPPPPPPSPPKGYNIVSLIIN